MRTIKLTLEYEGTRYNGWQVQANNQLTVQGEIEKALKKVFKSSIQIHGSGRTDSGVHAAGQVAHFRTSSVLTPLEILRGLNSSLPKDIAVIKAEEASKDFHAQYSAKGKIYRYTILNRPARTALQRSYLYHFPYKLNVSAMRRAAKCFVGRKDFRSYQATPAHHLKKRSTIRTINKIKITKKNDYIHIDFEAEGFLHKMVRNIVGTLLEVGREQLKPESIHSILEQKDRTAASRTAKAQGLTLISVNYK